VIPVHDRLGNAFFAVKIHPLAKKNVITGEVSGALMLSLTAPAIEGRANQACIDFFCEIFEGAAIFRYHCLRPDYPPKSYSCRWTFGGPSQAADADVGAGEGARATQVLREHA
jgi:hypothetical protein